MQSTANSRVSGTQLLLLSDSGADLVYRGVGEVRAKIFGDHAHFGLNHALLSGLHFLCNLPTSTCTWCTPAVVYR